MKKILLALIALIACLAVVGCSNGWTNNISDYSTGTVSSNGGFLVEKGDYVYLINGSEANNYSNTYGEPVKGSIVRVKKADIGKSDVTVEKVIPEICYSGSYENGTGIYIFGDYIYYTTPCSEKNKEGSVRNTELEFMKTKLDGTKPTVIATVTSNTAPYRFVEIDGVVYLTVYTTNSDSENVLRVYNTETKALVKESQKITDYVLSDSLTNKYAFYTTTIHNDSLDKDESFNSLRRISLDGSEDVEILNGAGKYSSETGIGIQGVTFKTIKYTDTLLIISETSVQTTTMVSYKGIEVKNIVGGETAQNYQKFVLLDSGSSFASTIFASTSIYLNLENIVYFDSTYGIVKYNYKNASDSTFGRTKIFYNADLASYTVKFVQDGYVYASSDSGVYYRFNLKDYINFENGELKSGATAEIKQLNFISINTSWFQPEMVGNYLLASFADAPYNTYIYASDITVTDGKTKEEIADYAEEIKNYDEDAVKARVATILGIMSDADVESNVSYYETTFAD